MSSPTCCYAMSVIVNFMLAKKKKKNRGAQKSQKQRIEWWLPGARGGEWVDDG